MIVLSATSGAIVIGAPVGIKSASFSFAFSLTTRIMKKLLKTTQNKIKKHNKIVIVARNKLNSIESTISKVLIGNEISHEDFTTTIGEERNYRELKEIIKLMKCQRSDIERN